MVNASIIFYAYEYLPQHNPKTKKDISSYKSTTSDYLIVTFIKVKAYTIEINVLENKASLTFPLALGLRCLSKP